MKKSINYHNIVVIGFFFSELSCYLLFKLLIKYKVLMFILLSFVSNDW